MAGFSKSLEFEGDGRIQDTGRVVFRGFYDGPETSIHAISPVVANHDLVQYTDAPLHIDSFGRVEAAPQTEINVSESDIIASGLRIFKPIEPTSLT